MNSEVSPLQVQFGDQLNTGPHGLDMDWSRLSMKKHENLTFLTKIITFNPCAHGSRPDFLEKINLTPVHEDFLPQKINPCPVSK